MMVVGLIKKNRTWIASSILVLYVASMPIVSGALVRFIENEQVRLFPDEVPEADAIVVLSGMLLWVKSNQGLVAEWADPDRFFGGTDLMLAERAPRLVFTAAKFPWDLAAESEGDVLKKHATALGIKADKILVTEAVENTEQEATAVSDLLREHKKIILVTSAFHMTRAQMLFEKAGLSVFPYPVDFRRAEISLSPMSFLPTAGALNGTDGMIREILGILFYKLKLKFFV